MELIQDGNPILGDVTRASVGSDTVFLFNRETNTLFINGHMKEWKAPDAKKPKPDEFSSQMNNLLKVVRTNPDTTCVFMVDANTQFTLDGGQLVAYSKDAKGRYVPGETKSTSFSLEGITVSTITSRYPTSYKMRGPHTAQLDKMLKPVKAVIDHVLIFNHKGRELVKTSAYVLNSSKTLQEITDENTPTTSPVSIADHALVISSLAEDALVVGTLNIKGGNTDDEAWAEFVPKEYYDEFNKDDIKQLLKVKMLSEAFPKAVEELESKKTVQAKERAQLEEKELTLIDILELSKPRCSIFDINLPNHLTPVLKIEGTSVHIECDGTDAVLNKNGDLYESSGEVNPELSSWVDTLLKDLNELDPAGKTDEEKNKLRETKRKFLLERGYGLLNYWHIIQTSEPTARIYDEWYKSSKEKVPISLMIKQAKEMNPLLKVIGIQELPKGLEDCNSLVTEIEGVVSCRVYFYDDLAINPTRGGIVVFNDVSSGGKRTKLRKTKKNKNKNKKKSMKRRLPWSA